MSRCRACDVALDFPNIEYCPKCKADLNYWMDERGSDLEEYRNGHDARTDEHPLDRTRSDMWQNGWRASDNYFSLLADAKAQRETAVFLENTRCGGVANL